MKIVVLDGKALNPGDLSYDHLHQYGDVTIYERTESEEETPAQEGEVTTKEFEVPDFLENEEDDIFKIE